MKRSEYIALGAVGLLAAATFWPRGADDAGIDPAVAAAQGNEGFQTLAFANLAECKDSQAVTALTCETEYGKASQQSVEDAPKFEAVADCEAEYGASQCRPATWNGASVFVPALAGVLIARSLAGGQATSQPLYPPRTGPGICPPGVSIADRPECGSRSSSSSSSSGGGGSSSGSSSRRYYSTGAGRVVGRVGTSVVADMILPSRGGVSRTSVTRAGSATSWDGSSASRSSTSGYSSSSTISRGGFGSTSRSSSSWGG